MAHIGWCLRKPEESNESPGAGDIGGFEPPDIGVEMYTPILGRNKQYMIFNPPEPFASPFIGVALGKVRAIIVL